MNSRQTIALLRDYESRNITFMEADGSWPIVWERAQGVHVWDAEGKPYFDLTAAFGVASAGHSNPRVVKAGQRQMTRMLHAMGDVHPHAPKAQLARELSRLTFDRWTPASRIPHPALHSTNRKSKIENRKSGKTIFCNSGFEAVEAALKTALLATGKPGIIAFEGGYHGLGYGALNATHREHFRAPFRSQIRQFGQFVPFPVGDEVTSLKSNRRKNETPHVVSYKSIESRLRSLLRRKNIGAILVEPIQARGGINIPPPEFLPLLRRLCDEHGALLILDEIYTGFGRTGKWFACEHSGVVPDLVCLGKALTGGFPLSACVGRSDLMDTAWPKSDGEAIHTSTFLGHPVGCAMALAQIGEIRRQKLVLRSAQLGRFLSQQLKALNPQPSTLNLSVRGLGLMAGLELRRRNGSPATAETLTIIKRMLHRGFILLPEGEYSNVIGFTPPLTITEAQLVETVAALAMALESVAVRSGSSRRGNEADWCSPFPKKSASLRRRLRRRK